MIQNKNADNKVGVTLAFYRKSPDGKSEAVMSSFVVEYSSDEYLEEKCKTIGDD